MNLDADIFVAGHNGMVGAAVLRHLKSAGYTNVITAERDQLDLADGQAVDTFFAQMKPHCVVMAAARVGGIHANNTYPAEFLFENLQLQNNVIHAAYTHSVSRLIFLGSSCIYPRLAAQPMAENELLNGSLEPTNEPYAIAKIAGIKLCESYNRQYGTDFRALMPTNLYGQGDNFHTSNSHVLPALIHRFHEAKLSGASEVDVWGSGTAQREFLHVDDLAQAVEHFMCLSQAEFAAATQPQLSHINIGTGVEISIAQLADLVKGIVGFTGTIVYDSSRPDGAPRKCLDVSLAQRLGWRYTTYLEDGLQRTYRWYLENRSSIRT